VSLTDAEWDAIALSLRVSVCAVAFGLPFAIAIAYWLARTPSRARWLMDVLVNLPVVLPPVVTGYFLLMLFGRNGPVGRVLESAFGLHLVFTWIGAAIAASVMAFPFVVRSARLGFEGIDPRLERAARTLGAGRARTFLTVSLPLAMRGIVAGLVLGVARAVGEFGATIMIAGNIPGRTQTVPLLIFSNTQTPGPMSRSWRLVLVSIAIAAVAILLSEWLDRRGRRNGRADV
jgi:molybdate transport system permease protein